MPIVLRPSGLCAPTGGGSHDGGIKLMPGCYDIIALTGGHIREIEIAGLAGILIIADIMAQIVFQQFFIFIPARRNLDIIEAGPNGFRGCRG